MSKQPKREGIPYTKINLENIGKAKAADQKKETPIKRKKTGAAPRRKPSKLINRKAQEKRPITRTKKNERGEDGEQPSLRVIPLGGIREIGKNMTVYECGDEAFIIDCGLSFPDDELLGIDIVIPDFTYVLSIQKKIRTIFITHGHEDHIGGLPYLLKELNVPVYGTALTVGLIKSKLEEHDLADKCSFTVMEPGDTYKVGPMSVEAIHVNHSIPGAVAFAVHTPYGIIVHTGDYKIDLTPVFDTTTDLARFGELGSEGVLALFSDSTNADVAGYSKSEAAVSNTFRDLFVRAGNKRIVIATFSSNIYRIQQIVNLAKQHGRKIAFSGRSMANYTNVAAQLGYLEIDDDLIVDIDAIRDYRPEDLIIITTGAQGEPMSALSRMASGSHRHVSIGPDDFIIISATPIPGNEKNVGRVVNQLLELGSEVIYESMYEVHASGHSCSGEHKLMLNLIKPKYFIPIHGEYKHLKKHADTALSVGFDERRIFIPELGEPLVFTQRGLKRGRPVPAGRVLVDGIGVGDVGSVVLRDRKKLGEDGLIVVICTLDSATKEVLSGPEIISRGYVFVKEADGFLEDVTETTNRIIEEYQKRPNSGAYELKAMVRDAVSELTYQKTKRSPMVIPVIVEI